MSLRDELTKMARSKAGLTPERLVDAARPPESPFHDRFEWDDGVAGEAYRKVQAAEIIRSYKITYSESPKGDRSVRAFMPTRSDGASSVYRPTEDILADEFGRAVLLAECKREWKAFQSKYQHLVEFDQIVNVQRLAS